MRSGSESISFRQKITNGRTIETRLFSDETIGPVRTGIRSRQEIAGRLNKSTILLGSGIRIGKIVSGRIKPIKSLNKWIVIDGLRRGMNRTLKIFSIGYEKDGT
jgi:hypothetical protein